MHLDMSPEVEELGCQGTSCINARRIEWKFLTSRPDIPGVKLPDSLQFAWHCAANFPWFNPLIVYNLVRSDACAQSTCHRTVARNSCTASKAELCMCL